MKKEYNLSDFIIEYAHEPITQSHVHTAPDYEIYLLLSGSSNYYRDDEIYSLSAGGMVFIRPDEMRWNQYTSKKYERYTLNFPVNFLPDEVMPMVNRIFDKHVISAEPDWCRKIFDTLHRERTENNEFSTIVIKNLLIQFFITLSRNNHINPDPNYNQLHPAVVTVTRYVDRHYAEPLTLEMMAELTHLNSSYLSKLFHAATGLPFKRYLMHIRIAKAHRILSLPTSKTISEIAYDCGFNDSNYFSRTFSSLQGMSPLEYKRSRMNKNLKHSITDIE